MSDIGNGHGSPQRSRSPSRSRSRNSYSRSRSRTRSKERKHTRRRSRSRSRSHRRRSRSRSYSNDRGHGSYGRRSRSRSPHRRGGGGYGGPRDVPPPPSRCLGVFGLSVYTSERDLREYFAKFGHIEDVQLVLDRQAKERAAGAEIDGHRIRVDFSVTKRAHTPTPGIYMGRPTYRRTGFDDRRASPSSSYSRRRSRSRSFSPRR